MEEIWIIGFGHFGQMAFRRLSDTRKDRRFVLVDPVAENLQNCKAPHAVLEVSDGIAFIENRLDNSGRPDWIIPALPVHLAAEWLLLHLGPKKLKRIPLPTELKNLVPNPQAGSEGNLYVSHADFKCPEDCDEPRHICTVTRQLRKENMFDILGKLDISPFKVFTIRSCQLGPGIGGYRPEQLFELRHTVKRARGSVMVSTACRCHGVISGLESI